MKKLIITSLIVLTSLVTFGQSATKIVKTFRCSDKYSKVFLDKTYFIDSLSKKGYVLTGFRIDQTFSKKGYNTQVLTFVKSVK